MSKTMKLIEQLVRGKGVLSEKYDFNLKRAKKVLADMIDEAEETAIDNEEAAKNALVNVDYSNKSSIRAAYNKYAELMLKADDYRATKEKLVVLTEELEKEVTVEDEKEK